MKKRIALLLLLMLALTVVLAACAQAEATKVVPRWDASRVESYEYRITLADFNLAEDGSISSPHFKPHGSQDNPFYKDFDVRAGEPFEAQDAVRPVSVSGTFTLTISHPSSEYDLMETKQVLEVTYNDKDGKLIDKEVLQELSRNNLVVSNNDGKVTLKSTTETTVEFKHQDNQAPIQSSTKVVGFYIGKAHQEVSVYEISTDYSYEDKNTLVKTTLTQNGETTNGEETLKRRSEGSFIDSNQLFLYARSLDKSSTSFQSAPSVTVYNPLSKSLQSANFTLTSSANVVLTDETRGELYTKLPILGITVDGMAFMSQTSLPKFQEKLPDLFDAQGNGPDVTYYGGFSTAKHTTVRFRVGYLSYELTQYEDDIWSALQALVSEKE